jgi:DNA-binding transcriptional LysR family regulator
VRPTETGAAFYRHCRRLLDAAEGARAEARAAQKTPTGRLRVASPDAFADRHIVPGLAAFLGANPSVQIELVEGSAALKLVEEGIDLAIRVVARPEPNLVVRRIATSRVVIVASPAYLAQRGTPARPRDVSGHRLIGFTPLAWRDTWQLGKETVAVSPALLTNSGASLRAAALAGLGLTPAPEWLVADALVAGQLTRVLQGYEPPAIGIYAVYPSNRLITPTVRAFVDHLARDLRTRLR